MSEISEKSAKRTRILYTIEADLEYLISILVGGSYLATLTKYLGFSDALTGVLSSIISLGCLFQLLSIGIRRTKLKKFVTSFSIINQLLFMLLYVIPITNLNSQVKTVIFVVTIILAYLLYYIAHPKKISWLMSFVDDDKRGRFTANKEIISLLTGMVFSFGMGALIDHFKEIGQTKTAFIISGSVIFVLMVTHSLTMIFSSESNIPPPEKDLKATVKELLKNKNLLRVAIVFVLYYVNSSIATPFYGSYQIKELGFSLTFVSIITIIGNVSRISVSRFWGKYADKKSFAAMIEKCLIFLGFSQICIVLCTPKVGATMYILYRIFHSIALGGLNSALINLIFDYVPLEKRADSLAVTQAFAGLAGFLATLCISPLVTYIQANGNKIFGLNLYAQQFITALSLFLTVITIIFVRAKFINKKNS